jgi:hypothetical protein
MSALAASIARMAPTSAHHWIGRDTAQKREHAKRTSRYMPHQGEQEMARRRAQMLKAHGKSPVVRFYGQLSGGESV